MQDDDTANPGMLWVLDGEALWAPRPDRLPARLRRLPRRCVVQHEGSRGALSRLRPKRGRPVDLEERINICRTEQQQAPALAFESKELLALTAYVAHQSRGMPIESGDPRLEPFIEAGREIFERRQGQLNLSCAQCHDDNWGQKLAGIADPAGASDRLSALSPRMADARLAAAAAAQLHDRHARRNLRLRLARVRRAGGFPDVARRGMPMESPAVRP